METPEEFPKGRIEVVDGQFVWETTESKRVTEKFNQMIDSTPAGKRRLAAVAKAKAMQERGNVKQEREKEEMSSPTSSPTPLTRGRTDKYRVSSEDLRGLNTLANLNTMEDEKKAVTLSGINLKVR